MRVAPNLFALLPVIMKFHCISWVNQPFLKLLALKKGTIFIIPFQILFEFFIELPLYASSHLHLWYNQFLENQIQINLRNQFYSQLNRQFEGKFL